MEELIQAVDVPNLEDNVKSEVPEEEIFADPVDVTDWNWILDIVLNPLFGWSVILILLFIVLFWNKIQNFLDNNYEKQQQREYDAKCHKNPDWVVNHHERMDEARRKLQEQYIAQATEHQIKKTERERQKNLEKLTKCTEIESGQRLGHGGNSSYNPLDGDSGSGRYRPQKKSKCPGGGCS